MAYYDISPFGKERDSLERATIACVVANAFRGKGRAYRLRDFMPFAPRKHQQTLGEMVDVLRSAAKIQNAKVARG